MDKHRRRLKLIHRWLELQWPGEHKVKVRVQKMPEFWKHHLGFYESPHPNTGCSRIVINRNSSSSEQVSTLLHEWAHYRVDPNCKIKAVHHNGHTNKFYLEYGRIERSYWKACETTLRYVD